jgi:hypothetical protein
MYFVQLRIAGKDIESPPSLLPSGWAAFLYLYGLR